MLDKNLIEEILNISMSTGARFAEVFVENKKLQSVNLINGIVENSLGGINEGVGIRLFDGMTALYAYTNDVRRESLLKVASELAMAVSQKGIKKNILPFVNKEIENKHIIKEMPVSSYKKDAVDFLRQVHNSAKQYSDLITETSGSYTAKIQNVLIANSEGLFVEDERVNTRVSVQTTATKNNDKQVGYESPGSFSGFEFIKTLDSEKLGNTTAELAVKKVNADYCPSGKMDVIIDNGFGGVIFHEACGHSLEATSVAKNASVFCGKMGEKIANEKVTAIDDGTMTNKWGSLNIDDEGNETKRNILIKDGILNSYLIDRLNGEKMMMKSTGSGRRESYRFAPTSRMTNTFIDNGADKFEDVIKNTEYGLYTKKMGGGSVQPTTGEFNFAALEAYIVRNGEICEPVKGATLIGKGQEVLLNIDMVCDNLKLAEGMCGSISGSIPTSVGQPTVRVKNLTVGGRK